ncbi:hypothetical protein [Labedella endophytica]|uniref:hypothetical protein n=1 Tax=Labedella endophytica TaxID=1523160 RepID=UPI00140AAE81|nr:hypothetical protein [Labedella endophytica]
MSRGDETSTYEAQGVPAEPVQPASTDDVYDGAGHDGAVNDHATNDHASTEGGAHDGPVPAAAAAPVTDGYPAEDREPYPIGATDAEPAPATTGSGDEIVVDYGSAQDPEDETPRDDEPPLTKPSPADDHHPYPPQALEDRPLADPTPTSATTTTETAAAAAGPTAASTTADRDDDGAHRPVYVQAPTPPKAKGNRGFGIVIGLLATAVFAALYLLVLVFVVMPFAVPDAGSATTSVLLETLTSAAFFVPVIVFFLAWALLVVILTRASWWGYVIGGFLVGVLTYAGYLAGILAANAFEVAPSQVPGFLLDHVLDAPALLAFIVAREVPIWFGVWVGKRGRAVRVRNAEARAEYERILEAGPTARS